MTCCPTCGQAVQAEQRQASGITERQRDLIAFIRDFKAKHGFSPSFVEMAGGIGISSKSGVARLVSGLEERGVIRRLKDKNRSVSIVGEFA
ncbi:LexA family protein [Neorhizobium sp. DAR64872/K0K18]|uniref:LexA family protein n=1 Tax=Neorhizobium sp. DAR64872/K0K18 TaxID=3421958 RepID=UPI003D28A3D0